MKALIIQILECATKKQLEIIYGFILQLLK